MNEELVGWIEANLEKVEKMTKITPEYLAGYLATERLQEHLSYRTLIYSDLAQEIEYAYMKPDDLLIYLNSLICLFQEELGNEKRSIEDLKKRRE